MSRYQHGPIDERLRPALRSGRVLSGVFNSIESPAIVEMAGYAGFDFIVLDNEHGSADLQTTEHQLRAARASGIMPVVRCLEHDIPRVLDLGVSGVQVPMVHSPEQAASLVARVRYPLPGAPAGESGTRGSAFQTRAAGYGAFGGAAHAARSNAAIALIVMVETPEALARAGEIAAVPGVDAVFIGPNDLAHSMGHGPNFHHPEVQALIAKALPAIAAAGCCPGILALSAEDRTRYSALGARYRASVTTGIIWKAFQDAARDAGVGVGY